MLFSHRQGVLYVEHCRIVAADGQLSFVRAANALEQFWSIPHANLCVLLCGPGTSITHQAARKLAEESVVMGFVGGGGTPLFFASQSEYRPTEYCQQWVSKWQEATWRLETAKFLAGKRCSFVAEAYRSNGILDHSVLAAIHEFECQAISSESTQVLLGHEATFAKRMYAYHRRRCKLGDFTRLPQGPDLINQFIDAGNYMAYGLAASVLWVLGIPHAFPVTHGMTRRGALVFDIADTVKDAMLLPVAFDAASEKNTAQQHRARCLAAIDRHKVLEKLFATVKEACGPTSEE